MPCPKHYSHYHVGPEVEHFTATFCILVPQCIRHNPRQPSKIADDNPAVRTCNRIKLNRAQNPILHDISSLPQAQKPGTSTGVGHPVISAKLVGRALVVLTTTVASALSSVSFVPLTEGERNSPRGDRREENDINIADDTIRGALPAGSARLSHREPEQVQSGNGSEPNPKVDANLEDR